MGITSIKLKELLKTAPNVALTTKQRGGSRRSSISAELGVLSEVAVGQSTFLVPWIVQKPNIPKLRVRYELVAHSKKALPSRAMELVRCSVYPHVVIFFVASNSSNRVISPIVKNS